IKAPDFLAVKIERRKVSRADEGVDVLAVRAGGRRRIVAFITANFAPPGGAAQLAFPQLFAVGAHAQEDKLIAVLASEEDPVAPDDGRRTGRSRQGELPSNVFSTAPCRRQDRFLTHPVIRWPAPLRPIFRTGSGTSKQQDDNEGPASNSACHDEVPR